MWLSKHWGHCVFDKIHLKHGGYVSNYLESKVHSYDINWLQGGGYYKIENLPDPQDGHNQIIDLYILIESVR